MKCSLFTVVSQRVEFNDNHQQCHGCRHILVVEWAAGFLRVAETNGGTQREMFQRTVILSASLPQVTCFDIVYM